MEREWVTGRELEMGNEREKGLVLVHLAVGMWYPSSDQGRIPRSSGTDTTGAVEKGQMEIEWRVAGLL